MLQKNRQKFAAIKKLASHRSICHNRQWCTRYSKFKGNRDIDIIVTAELWNVLAAKYGVTNETGVKR